MIDTKVFRSPEFGTVRVIMEDTRALFCGKDVALALGFAETRKALARHTLESLKRPVNTPGGVQIMTVIPQSDVYRLIVLSKAPKAQDFAKWLLSEALPAAGAQRTLASNERLSSIVHIPETLDDLEHSLSTDREKAGFYDAFAAVGLYTNISTVAKELNIPRGRFIAFLMESGFLFRTVRGELLPYRESMEKGLFVVKDFCQHGYFGVYTLITPKGKNLFRMLRDGEKTQADEVKTEDWR